MELVGYFVSVLIGISLGLIGGGGSILTMPILVYLFQIKPDLATSYSLFVVGITSFFGAIRHYKMGNLHLVAALYFAIPSLASLLFVRKFVLPAIPTHILYLGSFDLTKNILLMIVFGLLMIAAASSMIKRSTITEVTSQTNLLRLAFVGFMVGFITGFLGAGGGFLIIPALIFFGDLPIKQAIGTSLLIIFINSLIGFTGDLINGIHLNIQLLLTISIIAIAGMFVGTQLSKKIDGAKLKPIFGWVVLIMGCYVIVKELFLN
jgi:uncharacterized protein